MKDDTLNILTNSEILAGIIGYRHAPPPPRPGKGLLLKCILNPKILGLDLALSGGIYILGFSRVLTVLFIGSDSLSDTDLLRGVDRLRHCQTS